MLPSLILDDDGGQGPQAAKEKPDEVFSWDDHVRRMDEDQFKLRYRLDFDSFHSLLDDLGVRRKLEHSTAFKKKQACNGNFGIVIAVEVKLALCLRYLAGGDVLDLILIYKVSKFYVYECLWAGVDAINESIKVEFPLHDVDKLRRLEAEFRARSQDGCWRGCVGAIDGVHFEMEAPTNRDVKNPMKYHVARKHAFCLLAIAVCDSERRFTMFDISQVPTTHDSLAFGATPLGVAVQAGKLPAPFFLNGDAAFSLSPSLVTPSGDPALDDFDYVQSSNRMAIECAFGILVKRWGVLYKRLRVRFDRRAALIGACMRLHNFCIDRRIETQIAMESGLAKVQPGRWVLSPIFDRNGRPVEYMEHVVRGPPQRHRATEETARTATRDRLAKDIYDLGITRPALPDNINRRAKKRRGAPGRGAGGGRARGAPGGRGGRGGR